MSKRNLKIYLEDLTKEQVAEQLVALYDKFSEVKVYYDFVFNPKEDKLVQEAKIKIANEYFPIKSKRPKLRRSVAQKYIKHFITLGVDGFAIADVMFFTIETAQKYSAKREMKYIAFYKSIQIAFDQAVHFVIFNGMVPDFKQRIFNIYDQTNLQHWENAHAFERIVTPLYDQDEVDL